MSRVSEKFDESISRRNEENILMSDKEDSKEKTLINKTSSTGIRRANIMDSSIIKRTHSRKSSFNQLEMTSNKMLASIAAIVFCCLLQFQLASAGGKGKGGGEGNIIISTGGGQTTKIKILKVPVPFPVIKHVPYPVPVPIIQKKYIPVEKYIPVYKHHHEGHESQQHEQYGQVNPMAGASALNGQSVINQHDGGVVASSSTTANSYMTDTQGVASANQSPLGLSSYNSIQQMYQSAGATPQSIDPSSAYSSQLQNPDGAASMGYDSNNIYSGSNGYSIGYSAGSNGGQYGQMYASGAQSGSMNPFASYPAQYGAQSPMSYYRTSVAGSDPMSTYQQMAGGISPFTYASDVSGASGRDASEALYHQSSGLNLYTSPEAGLQTSSPSSSSSSYSGLTSSSAVSSSSSSASPGSSSLNPRYVSQSSSASSSSSSASPSSGHSTRTGQNSSPSTAGLSRQNRDYGTGSSKGDWRTTSAGKSGSKSGQSQFTSSPSSSGGRGSSGSRNSGSKTYSSTSGSSASSSSISSQVAGEMMATPSAPIVHHQTDAGPLANQATLAGASSAMAKQQLNRQQQQGATNSQTPSQLVTPTIVSPVNSPAQFQHATLQQQATGTNGNNSQQQQSRQQTQSLLGGTLLASNPVGSQIMQQIRKFTDQLTNSTQPAQQAGSTNASKLLG